MAGKTAEWRKILKRGLVLRKRPMILAGWYTIYPVAWSTYQQYGRGLIILDP